MCDYAMILHNINCIITQKMITGILIALDKSGVTLLQWKVIITTLYQLMLLSWYQKNCPIIGKHVGIKVVTQ